MERHADGVARFAWGVLGYNLLVIGWGAYVRATGSGAGCGSHWPLCNGTVVPRAPRMETLVEFTHRATSGLAALSVFALAWWVFRSREKGDAARTAALVSAALIIVEALLGAGLVLFGWVENDASWGRVASLGLHLTNTFLLLGALALTASFLNGAPAVSWRGTARPARALAGAPLVAILIVAVTGAMTSLGDTLFPAESLAAGFRQDFAPTAHFLERLRVIHPALALLSALVVIVSATRIARFRADARTVRLARVARALVLLQIVGGFANLALLAPTWMQLAHLLLADTLWIVLVLLSAQGAARVVTLSSVTAPRLLDLVDGGNLSSHVSRS
jgi:cytochrome c oxidase assembly protein subunit 15